MYKELLGEEWARVLESYLVTGDLTKVSKLIRLARAKGQSILPPEGSDMFFKIFKLLQPSDIKVIVLAQDPYFQNNPLVMTGIAFDCSSTYRIQPSLANIIKEIKDEYPDRLTIDRGDLMYLVKQGVFLVNTALSVVENKPGSHKELWNNFTTSWIKLFQEKYNDKIWLLAGRDSQSYKKYITNPSHYIIETSHPSPLGATKEAPIPFLGSGCFKTINNELDARNITKIYW